LVPEALVPFPIMVLLVLVVTPFFLLSLLLVAEAVLHSM
jgi:hypothetical protein